jgi:hypothetical protein
MSSQICPIGSLPTGTLSQQQPQNKALVVSFFRQMATQQLADRQRSQLLEQRVSLIEQKGALLLQQKAIQNQQIEALKKENERLRQDLEKGAQELTAMLKESHEATRELKLEAQKMRLQASITDLKLKRKVLEGEYSYYEQTLPYVAVIPIAGYPAVAAALFMAKGMRDHNIQNKQKIDAITKEIGIKQEELKALEAPPTEKN